MTESFEASVHSPDIGALRRTARQRFVGAAALVFIAVVALPFVLDTKPRPVSPDIAIEIQNPTPAPKPAPDPVKESAPKETYAAPPVQPAAPSSSPVAQLPAADSKSLPELAFKPETTKPNAQNDEAARVTALLNGGGYHIQAGSFTDKTKLVLMQEKLEKAGFKTYTQDAIAKDGTTHTRIRLGPFTTQAEANNTAARLGKLGIKTIVIKP